MSRASTATILRLGDVDKPQILNVLNRLAAVGNHIERRHTHVLVDPEQAYAIHLLKHYEGTLQVLRIYMTCARGLMQDSCRLPAPTQAWIQECELPGSNTVEARKLAYDRPLIPKQKKEGNQPKSPQIHIPTFWSLLYIL